MKWIKLEKKKKNFVFGHPMDISHSFSIKKYFL